MVAIHAGTSTCAVLFIHIIIYDACLSFCSLTFSFFPPSIFHVTFLVPLILVKTNLFVSLNFLHYFYPLTILYMAVLYSDDCIAQLSLISHPLPLVLFVRCKITSQIRSFIF